MLHGSSQDNYSKIKKNTYRIFIFEIRNNLIYISCETELGTDHLTLWLFVSFRKKISDNTRVKILLFMSRKARNFFPDINIRLYYKNSESDYFFFPPPKSEYFFQQHWESEYFF